MYHIEVIPVLMKRSAAYIKKPENTMTLEPEESSWCSMRQQSEPDYVWSQNDYNISKNKNPMMSV